MVLLACAAGVFAQVATKTGSIYGRVMDLDGRTLPGVTVTLEAEGLAAQVATTTQAGSFRFANLPPGNYSVAYSIEGYTQVTQEDVAVSIGVNTQVDMKLGQNPTDVIDVVGPGVMVNTSVIKDFSRDALQSIPNSRDPWSLMEQAPAIDTDRYSVACSECGQQAAFVARGDSGANTIWNYEGVNATDPGALGASPTYFDFDAFQELSISTAGNDVSAPTGGVVVNIVTRRAGNRWEGNGSFYFVNDSLQGNNTPDELEAIGQEKSNRLDEVKDYGFDLGGPIVKDKLFAWGAFHKNEIGLFTVTNISDRTILTDYNLKTNMSWNTAHESQFAFFQGEKEKHGRGFNPFIQAPETLWDQAGTDTILPGIWTGQHTWIPNDHTIITGRYGYIGLGFSLVPTGGKNVPMILLAAIPRYEQTGFFNDPIDRPSHDIVVDGNYFKDRLLGGDHEFKFGFEYKTSKLHTFSSYGNGTLIEDYYQTVPGGPLTSGYMYAQHYIDGHVRLDHAGVYASDTYRKDRLTLQLGLRLDRQTGSNDSSSIPGVPGFEDLVGPLNFAGNDPGVRFNDWSPRIGASYDLGGDGKTVIRGNFARYYDTYNSAFVVQQNPTFSYNGAVFSFENRNGDRIITRDEITGGPFYYGGLNGPTFDLNAFLDKNKIDPDLKNSNDIEFLAGIERQITQDLSVSATFTHRDYLDTTVIVPDGIAENDYVQTGTFTANTTLGSFSVPYYALGFTQHGTTILRNINDYKTTYNGLDIGLRKRMSRNFMVSGSLTLQRQKAHYNGGDSAGFYIGDGGISGQTFPFDPTNLPFLDGQPYAFAPGGSGKAGVYPYSEWQLKWSGVYQLPHDISAGAFVRYQQGYPYVLFGTISDSTLGEALGTSRHLILVEPFGSRRFDNIFTMDLQFEKAFDTGSYGRLALTANLFNVTNANTIIRRTRSINSQSLNAIEENLSPRALRLGLRYSF